MNYTTARGTTQAKRALYHPPGADGKKVFAEMLENLLTRGGIFDMVKADNISLSHKRGEFLMGILGGLLGDAETSFLSTLTQIEEIVTTIKLVFFALVGTLLVFFAIWVGYKMAKAEDDGKRKEAKTQLIYAIIGLVGIIALSAMFGIILPQISGALSSESYGTSAISGSVTEIMLYIDLIIATIMSVIQTLASIFAVWIGWQFMKAEDDGKRKQAKQQLLYTVIGLVGVALIQIIASSVLPAVAGA